PEASPWRHDKGSRERPPKREGGHFGLRATSAWIARQRPTRRLHPRLTLDSPSLTLDSPALRVGAGKSGVGGGAWKVSSPQFSVLFPCQDLWGKKCLS